MSEEKNKSEEELTIGNKQLANGPATEQTQPQTSNVEPQTTDMEVHQHSHTPRKKWTHYFWEFLMLFLAVTLGFFVENQREHMIENRREKEYITSLIRDVAMDIESLNQAIPNRERFIRFYDSLVMLLKYKNKSSMNDIYFYSRFLARIPQFNYHDRTIEQLKSSGNMRLVRVKEVADSITIYDSEVIKTVLYQQEFELQQRNSFFDNLIGKIFNAHVWNEMVDSVATISRPKANPDLITGDAALINDFIMKVVTLKTTYRVTIVRMEKAIQSARILIEYLKREYQMK